MAERTPKTWREIRRQRPLNEAEVAAYRRLMHAELQLAEVRRRRGISEAAMADALEDTQRGLSASEQQDDDLYFSTLARYVAALGGHLEVRAVFPEETVMLLREPGEESDSSRQ